MIYKFINCQEHETNNIHSAMINNLLQEVDIALGKINDIMTQQKHISPMNWQIFLPAEKYLQHRKKKETYKPCLMDSLYSIVLE